MIKRWEKLVSETVFQSDWFDVQKNKVSIDEQKIIDDYYVIKNKDAVMIAGLLDNGNILMKREYRLPVDEILLELPAGAIEDDDISPLEAAKREFREETGCTSNTWKYIGTSFDCPDRCSSKLHLFIADHCERTSEGQQLDINERIDVEEVSLERAIDLCMGNEIKVNSCVHLIIKAAIYKKFPANLEDIYDWKNI